VSDQVFGVIQKKPAARQGKVLKAFTVISKGIAHTKIFHALPMVEQIAPCRQCSHIIRFVVVIHAQPFFANTACAVSINSFLAIQI
jgi:hypothetical protein